MSFLLNFDGPLSSKLKSLGHEKFLLTAADPIFSSAFLLSYSQAFPAERPLLVVTKDEATAQRLQQHIALWSSWATFPRTTHMLPHHDVSPYSGLYSPRKNSSTRMGWLYHASFPRRGDIFIAPLRALAQKTLPLDFFLERCHEWAKTTALPENVATFFSDLGYSSVPLVEDVGTFSLRGGILDVFSPAEKYPIRIELFGDIIESLRFFDPSTQRSLDETSQLRIIPAQEILFTEDTQMRACKKLEGSSGASDELMHIKSQIRNQILFDGIDFLLPHFYQDALSPLDFFSGPPLLWMVESIESESLFTSDLSVLIDEFEEAKTIFPAPKEIYLDSPSLQKKLSSWRVDIESLEILDSAKENTLAFPSRRILPPKTTTNDERTEFLIQKCLDAKKNRNAVFLFGSSESQFLRLQPTFLADELRLRFIETAGDLESLIEEQKRDTKIVHFLRGSIDTSFTWPSEVLTTLSLDEFLKKGERKSTSLQSELSRAQALSFSELREGDPVVHAQHGVAVYHGLRVMDIGGVEAEFLELRFKDNDKLFLPIYRLSQVHKYSGAGAHALLDKLGGKVWEKTKSKVQSRLREIATELVSLYAKRQTSTRSAYDVETEAIAQFERQFPYEETADQLRAIKDIKKDLSETAPMDRLICGDVGFGKTEVAMRAAFIAASQGRQVAVLAPTTILTFQHFETFKKRFQHHALRIAVLNRFVSPADIKKIITDAKEGRVDILIGTHRLLSQDVGFKNLGLLIIDEEQKFGVKHKEKIRHYKNHVDTLAMSATPIPRTLNMSLLGIRDLSLINTAPHDRLPTRTFVSKFDEGTIKKAVMTEIKRGGQIFFLHNRVQSIYSLADQLRELLPGVKMAVAHGQMDEHELEKTIVSFFHKDIDMLICTTIIEAGMDIPNANTMFVDQAHALGLSQLYQLRGRVGRSKQRAFCYLLIPRSGGIEDIAKERLRILQQNTALGSGIQIAQYDLELRGAGTLLGEEQSGAVDAIGYEMYMDLLEQAVHEARGEQQQVRIEPEINLKIKALIPHNYMPDIRLRLSYYKALSSITNEQDLDQIEADLRDQFGTPPEEVYNLLGLMTLRHLCKELGIRDLSSGPATVSLAFTESTSLPTAKVVELSLLPNKKYAITPDSRLRIRMNEVTWQNIYEELVHLRKLAK